MKDMVIVTGYKDMCFTVKENGADKQLDMLKLTCISKSSGSDAIGYLPIQLNYMDERKKEIAKSLTFIPGLYEAEYGMVPGKNNKPSLEIIGFSPVKQLDFNPLFNNNK